MGQYMSLNNIENIHLAYLGKCKNKIMPLFYVIEPTNCCNYACPICPNRNYRASEKGYMNMALFKRILEQIKDFADVIQLYWVGEPLLSPSIIDMIKYCKRDTHAKIMLSSNGSLLTKETVDKIVGSGLDKLIISMDAAESNKIYNQIRTNGDIRVLNENTMEMIKRNSQIDITLQFILTNVNEEEKERFVKKWARYPVTIRIQCLYTWANQLPELNDFSNHLSPMIGKRRRPCSDLWYKMVVHWNGQVSLCCFDWTFKNVIGDLNTQSIEDIWNSDTINRFRSAHMESNYSGLCEKCDAWATEDEYKSLF